MGKYIKNVFEKTSSVLNEGIVDKVAQLLGMDKESAQSAIDDLSFADYLELGNAIDLEDVSTATEILGVGGLEEGDNAYSTQPSVPTQARNAAPMTTPNDEQPEKQIDDLKVGDEVEVVDIDGQPAAGRIRSMAGPGNTIIITGHGNQEHIIKRDSVMSTPKLEEGEPYATMKDGPDKFLFRKNNKQKLVGSADNSVDINVGDRVNYSVVGDMEVISVDENMIRAKLLGDRKVWVGGDTKEDPARQAVRYAAGTIFRFEGDDRDMLDVLSGGKELAEDGKNFTWWITFVTKDSAPDRVGWYERTTVRAATRAEAKIKGEEVIDDFDKPYVRVSKIKKLKTFTESAPPGMEDWIKKRKPEFKKRYGDDWESVLYATAWKQKNNESLEESDFDWQTADEIDTVDDLGFDPYSEYGTRRGDILRAVNTRQGPGLKVKGMSGLLSIGDWVELEDGRGLKITKIGPGKTVKLDDGKFYSLKKIRFPIDETIEEGEYGIEEDKTNESYTYENSTDITDVRRWNNIAKKNNFTVEKEIDEGTPTLMALKNGKVVGSISKDYDGSWSGWFGNDIIKESSMSYSEEVEYWKRSLEDSMKRKGVWKKALFAADDESDVYDAIADQAESIASTYHDSGDGIGSSDINHFIASIFNQLGIDDVFGWRQTYDEMNEESLNEYGMEYAYGDTGKKYPATRAPKYRATYKGKRKFYHADNAKVARQKAAQGFKISSADKKLIKIELVAPKGTPSKNIIEDTELARIKALAGIKETASGGATGAGAIASAPTAVGGMVSRNPSIYATADKPAPKVRKVKKKDGIGRTKKD
jgi:hypothetical protein